MAILYFGSKEDLADSSKRAPDPPFAYCVWFDEKKVKQESSFPIATLVKV